MLTLHVYERSVGAQDGGFASRDDAGGHARNDELIPFGRAWRRAHPARRSLRDGSAGGVPYILRQGRQFGVRRRRTVRRTPSGLLRIAFRQAFGTLRGEAHDLLSFAGLQVAFLIPIECDDDMIGHGQFQAGSGAQYGAAVALQGSACERDASSRSRAKRRSACPSLPLALNEGPRLPPSDASLSAPIAVDERPQDAIEPGEVSQPLLLPEAKKTDSPASLRSWVTAYPRLRSPVIAARVVCPPLGSGPHAAPPRSSSQAVHR